MTAHLHAEIVPGCYRCDLNRDEVEAAEQEEAEELARHAACPAHDWKKRVTPFETWSVCSLCRAEMTS